MSTSLRRVRGGVRRGGRLASLAVALAVAALPCLAAVAVGPSADAQTGGLYADIPASFWDAGRIAVAVKDGFVAPYGAYFRPTWAFTEANLATALTRLPHGPSAAAATALVVQAERTAGSAYGAQGTVTHAVFALALVQSLGLGQVAGDLAGASSPWPDGGAIPAWDRGSSTLMARLGLNWGNTWAGTFQATGGVERDQAAWALVGAANLERSAIDRAEAPVVAAVRVSDPPTGLSVGQSVTLSAQVVDAGGHPLPIRAQVSASGSVAVRAGDVVYGVRPGTGEVVVRSSAGAASAILRVTVAGGANAGGAGQPSGPGAGGGSTGSSSAGGSSTGATAAAKGPFADVPAGSWYAQAAVAAARAGLVPALKDGDFMPDAPLSERDLARAVAAWKKLTAAGAQALVADATGAYHPDRVVDHAQFVEAVAEALGLSVVARDEAALPAVERDTAALPNAVRGSATAFAHLGLSLGDLRPGRLDPAAPTTRAEAAYALVAAAALPEATIALEASRVVVRVTAPTPDATPVVAGSAVTLEARALDHSGRVVPSALAWHASDGTIDAAGVFMPKGAGKATVTVTAPLSGAHATSSLTVGPPPPPPPVSLSVVLPAGAAAAGQSAKVTVDVDSTSGLDAADSGRSITLSVTGPQGTSEQTATDKDGVATFTVTPTTAGAYTLSASAQGLTDGSSAWTVADPSALATALAVGAPSPAQPEEGAAATLTVTVDSASGQALATDQGRAITLTLSQTSSALPAGSPSVEAPTVLTATDVNGVATFSWTAGLPGDYSAQATSTGLTAGTAAFTVTAAPAAAIVLSAPSSDVVVGQTVAITAMAVDAGGQATVATLPISVGLGAGSPGSIADTLTTLDSNGVVAQFTAPAAAGGTAVVIVTSPGLPPAEVSLDIVASLPTDVPSFAGAPYTTVAGTAADVVVDVGASAGTPDASSNGVPVTLTVTPPAGAATTLTMADVSGVASFPVTETAAGAYGLSASIPGESAVKATLTVEAGAPATLTLTAAPSSLLMPGQTAALTVGVEDAYGNPEPATAAVPVTVTATPATVGSVTVLAAAAPGVVADFTASAGGTATVTASSPGLASASITILVETTRASLVSGKGMWLMWQDWHTVGAEQIVATAVADHITSLYLEVATTSDGFYGTDALNSLLPLAHAAHIAVIAWVYTALTDPAADAAMTVKVAQYLTPTGDSVDGVAADIEDVLTVQAVGAYADAVRAALPHELFVGVTYPPMYHMSYPYAALAKDVDVIAPMDYWHSMPKAYTPTDVYDYVEQSINLIRQLDGQAGLPIAPIGQAYDMFTDSGTGPNNPTPAEITAAFDAAEADGAIGFSLYRWGTATTSEWKTWTSLVWGQQSTTQGASS